MVKFLSKTEAAKIKLLRYLALNKLSQSVRSSAEHLEVTARTVSRYFDDLEKDCQTLLPQENISFEKSTGILALTLPETTSINYIVDYLRLNYSRNSVGFQIIKSLLRKKYETVNELAEELFTSPTNLYYNLYTLEGIISQFDMSFSFVDNETDSNFIYEGHKLRLFSYYFYWNFYKGLEVPLQLKYQDELELFDTANNPYFSTKYMPTKQAQVRYIAGICHEQIKEHQEVQFESEFAQIVDVFIDVNDVSRYFPFFNLCQTTTQEQNERRFFNLLMRLKMPDMDNLVQKRAVIERLAKLDKPIINNSRKLVSMTSEYFDIKLSGKNMIQFYYHSVLFFSYMTYFQLELPEEYGVLRDVKIYQKEAEDADLNQRVSDFYAEFNREVSIPDEYSEMIKGVIRLSLHSSEKQPLQIALQLSKNIMAEPLVHEKIKNIFNPEMVKFTPTIGNADIIISDGYEGVFESKDYFYMDDLIDGTRWQLLFRFIQEKLFEKEFSPYAKFS